jgi:hypothetical protein
MGVEEDRDKITNNSLGKISRRRGRCDMEGYYRGGVLGKTEVDAGDYLLKSHKNYEVEVR